MPVTPIDFKTSLSTHRTRRVLPSPSTLVSRQVFLKLSYRIGL